MDLWGLIQWTCGVSFGGLVGSHSVTFVYSISQVQECGFCLLLRDPLLMDILEAAPAFVHC